RESHPMKSRQSFPRVAALALAALLAIPALPAAADDDQSSSWRRYDATGRFAGTAYRRSPDQLRFYDAKGRFAGTALRTADGNWRTYDQRGRFSGTLREGQR
ncbi:MAG: hypothetical protein L6Q83_14035, partial [Gammaproteobacteria bacterium]|nr:hypothetical protein [Gammaproteobacteria bacterium]